MNNTELSTAPQSSGLSIFDSGTFDTMGAIASQLAASSLIPASLKGSTKEETSANCFRVVEQAARWGLSPFAVMDSASVVHGKLMWEGKLIAAAIKASLGVRLRYEFSGSGDQRKVIVSGDVEGTVETIEGTVADWKTTGKGSPWDNLANRDQMLSYRGARQWARRHAPEVILGVYSPDEFNDDDLRNVTPRNRVEVRTEPLDPSKSSIAAPEPKEEVKEEPAPETPKTPETIPAQGKQKKDRHCRDGYFQTITEKTSQGGKTFWVVNVTIKGKSIDFLTFSASLAGALAIVENDTPVSVTFTVSDKGSFQLEDYSVKEGELI